MSAYYSRIIGTGSGFPERFMTNAEFESIVDTSDEWIRSRTGIETRAIADPAKGETTSVFAETAARKAIEMAGIDPQEIEAIVVGTVTPDSILPTVANQLQEKLGATRAFSFDLAAACSGFLYSLSVADGFIRLGTVRTALVLGAETLSTFVDWKERKTCVLFGDGAGAALLQRAENDEHAVLATHLHSDGRYGDILKVPHGFSRVPPYFAEYRNDMRTIKMQGAEVFKIAVRSMIESSNELLRSQGVKSEEVDFFIFHQANIRIIEMCMKTLGVPPEKTWINVQKYGNTSAATLPVALDEAWRAGAVKSGDLILMATFGGGATWASSLIRL